MNRRRNLILALTLFLVWVGFLAFMARFSAERPRAVGGVGAPG